VFTFFMLIDREGLRNRLLKLMGQGKLQATTKAMDDAGQRVSRYVLMQFTVNAGFGAVIATGLYLIGVPSSLLWGVLGMFLRFLPYVGPLIAWLLPFVLTFAVSDNWRTPVLVTILFFVTEMVVGNVVEPLLYGVHTGLSAVAIVVSAVFWTVIWGPIGLVLATPLTVCLSVLGRHSPQLEFLNIVLGDEPVLTPDAIFYQRLIALDQQDALNVLETLGKGKPLIQVFDDIVIPALARAERDRHTGQLDAKREDFILQSINEFVTELSEAEAIPVAGRTLRSTRVFCFPAHGAADEIAAAMCAHFLTQEGFPAIAFPLTDSPGQLVQALGVQADDVICISAVPPFAAGHARKLAKNIRESGSEASILAGLWGYMSTKETTSAARLERLRKSLSGEIAASLAEAVACVKVLGERNASNPAKLSA
jgi:methylmalonyl-CoA mutase cobalamin-binding subunit